MQVDNINSKRKISIVGNGWNIGKIQLKYIGRHACNSAILDEEDFELEEGKLEIESNYINFSNTMKIIFENLDTTETEYFDFKNLKKLGIYNGDLDPEDLMLTNSFEKIPKKCINHWEYDDDQYYLEYQESWKGNYGEFTFKAGELFNINKLNIRVYKLDTGNDFYEWGGKISYIGKKMIKQNINSGIIKKILRTY